MQLGCRQTQGLGDTQRSFERQRGIQFRNGLAKLDEGFRAGGELLDTGGDPDDACALAMVLGLFIGLGYFFFR